MAFGSQDELNKVAPTKPPVSEGKGSFIKWALIIAAAALGWYFFTGQEEGLKSVASVASAVRAEKSPAVQTTAKPEMITAPAPTWANKATSGLVPVE